MSQDMTTLGLVGAGVMGLGVAQIAVQAGLRVLLMDARPGAAEQGKSQVLATLQKLHDKGKVDARVLSHAQAALVPVQGLAELAECDLVIEAIVEQLEAKQALMRDLESVVSPHALLATNTSVSYTHLTLPTSGLV